MKHGKKENQEAEAQAYLKGRNAKMDRLVEKWNKNTVGYGLEELAGNKLHRARVTAQMLENQNRHMKKFSEAIITQNFSTRPENVLKVVRIGSANSNRGEFATEFPLTTVDDAIFFIDMIYQDTKRGATANDKIYEASPSARFYAGEMYEETGTQSGTTHNFTCTTVPIIKGKIFVMYQRKMIGYDDGANGFTALDATVLDAANSSVTSYATGTVVITTFASAAVGDVQLLVQFDSENSTLYTEYGKVSLTISKKRFNARPMPLGYTYSSMTELMLGTEGLGDAEDMLLQTVGDEHARSKDYKAIAILRSIALLNDVYTFDTDFAAAGEVSNKSHAQSLLPKVGSISGNIYDSLKRGKVNKAIAGSQALEYMKKHDLWKTDESQDRVGVYYAGKFDDIDTFCCPEQANLVGNDEIILTYKNPLEGMDVGVAFGVLTELTASLAYPEFYVDGNIASVEDYLPITTGFVRKLQLTNLTFG